MSRANRLPPLPSHSSISMCYTTRMSPLYLPGIQSLSSSELSHTINIKKTGTSLAVSSSSSMLPTVCHSQEHHKVPGPWVRELVRWTESFRCQPIECQLTSPRERSTECIHTYIENIIQSASRPCLRRQKCMRSHRSSTRFKLSAFSLQLSRSRGFGRLIVVVSKPILHCTIHKIKEHTL